MLNVQQITSTLAKLPDQQLQQYAQMHKSDPYIMALAVSESNRRKEMRSAGQGAQGAQEQPKVVDRDIAGMAPPAPQTPQMAQGPHAPQLPEEMGIGRLPAGNMHFADGGIVAFAGGGGVEGYSGEANSLVGEGVVYDPVTGMPVYNPYNQVGDDQTTMERLGLGNRENRRVLEQMEKDTAFRKAHPSVNQATMPAAGYTRTDPRAAGFAADVKAVNATGAGQPPSPGLTALGAPRVPGAGDLASLYKNILGNQNAADPAANELKQLETAERTAATESKDALLRDQEKFADAYKGRENRLAEREADIGKQKDTNTGLAFLNAGLAIMSTPGGLAAAIGKGAQVGTAQFAAGLDKIRSAQERLSDARDRMEELKLNRDEMSAKEIRAAEDSIRNVTVNAQKRAIDGIRTAAEVNRKTAGDIFGKTVDLQRTQIEQAGANARAGMPSGEMRAALMLGTGTTDAARLESGMKKLQEITADKSGMAAVKLLAETNAKLAPGEPKVTMSDLLSGAREFSALMYPKVGNVAPTRDRP